MALLSHNGDGWWAGWLYENVVGGVFGGKAGGKDAAYFAFYSSDSVEGMQHIPHLLRAIRWRYVIIAMISAYAKDK